MKKKNFLALAIAAVLVFAISCTPEKMTNNEYQDDVDKDKIERPGSQGGN